MIPLFKYECMGRNGIKVELKAEDGWGVGTAFELPPSDMGGARNMIDTLNAMIIEYNDMAEAMDSFEKVKENGSD